jgi:hypothetical protein
MKIPSLFHLLRGTVALLAALCIVSAHAATTQQRAFPSAEEAAAALVSAVKARDRKAIVAVLGPGTEKWVWSGDAAADRATGERFVAAYERAHTLSPAGDNKMILELGPENWPFAFPLVKSGAGWRFDSEAGKDELLARRIGENELAVMNVMLAIVDAQRDYVSADRDRSGVRQYARKFASSAGKQDGLYWTTKAGEPPSPLGPLMTRAAGEGYKKEGAGPMPYHGYYFRMLTGQGASARGGALDYVVKGRMIGGFGVVAYPASYGNSGVMTFIVNHDGKVFEKDLGPDTAKIASAMTRFDPDSSWTPSSPK